MGNGRRSKKGRTLSPSLKSNISNFLGFLLTCECDKKEKKEKETEVSNKAR